MIQTRKVQYQCMSKLSPRELASRAHQFLAESEKRSASNKKSYTVSSSTGMCCYHYTKVIVVRPSVRPYGWEFTGSESTPVQKALFLRKAEVWCCKSWLTDTASNGTSSRLKHAF